MYVAEMDTTETSWLIWHSFMSFVWCAGSEINLYVHPSKLLYLSHIYTYQKIKNEDTSLFVQILNCFNLRLKAILNSSPILSSTENFRKKSKIKMNVEQIFKLTKIFFANRALPFATCKIKTLLLFHIF